METTSTTTRTPGAGAAELVGTLGHLIGADIAASSRDELDVLVGRSQRLRSWLDAVDVKLAARAAELADQGSAESAGEVLRNQGRRSRKDAEQAARRSRTCDLVPGLQDALAEGRVSGSHVDAIANAAASLDEEAKAKLGSLAGEVIDAAASQPVEKFERQARNLARILSGDSGESRQARLRRQRKVKRWVDQQTGMANTLIQLDPAADASMWTAIDAAVGDDRRDQQPGDDRSYDHLQVDTIVDLICGSQGVDPRVPEVCVLIDLRSLLGGPHPTTTAETSGGEPVDVDTVRRLGCDGDLVAVLLDEFGHCLNVGRARRLATREQRQALRAMYRSCGFGGCDVAVDRCRIHHVTWWEQDGVTDLDNLIPLCSVHHHLVHEGGWQLTITPDRTITLHRPDGTIHYQGDTTNRTPVAEQHTDDIEPGGDTRTHSKRIADLADQLTTALHTIRTRHAETAQAERPPP